ncbi:MAG: carbamoyl transferase [Sedimenticola thiotaurini]|uniref:Carbamoyl transferase n=1 Tax=Sedimenticola thiotaurini TaxID=1543721 RepID=A0A558DAT2_9GAMM|nr:MAG: carbamoyl transferase [Sedimenticola thiotaurini]
MNILGIANDETASACLIKGGELVAAASEERFTRIKMDSSWPQHSIDYCLKAGDISLEDVNIIAYGWSAGFDAERHLLTYFDRIAAEAQNKTGLDVFRERISIEIERDAPKRDEFAKFARDNNFGDRVVYIDHHDSHAYSAYCCAPFDEALVLTCDGRGDFTSLTASVFTRDSHSVLYRAPSIDSLGFFYGRITKLLGFVPHRHEGKITGLAARGNPNKLLPLMKKMIDVEDGRIVAHLGDYFRPFYSNFSDELQSIVAANSKEDVAAAAQLHLEQCVSALVEYYTQKTRIRNVCLAGGVFANVRVNQCIMEIDGVDNIFVQPQMGDGGLCVGAVAGFLHQNGKPKINWRNMYLGPSYADEEISGALSAEPQIDFIKSEDVISDALDAIARSEVVGLFQGRMEFGPRALCNRSIIYHCRDVEVNDWLNKRMVRTEFMPFAPVLMSELAERCFVDWKQDHVASRFMTVTYQCTDFMKQASPAVVHVDGTARPQVVFEEDNPFMHSLLGRYFERTGEPALINTSFNRHEEPIVASPVEAIDALRTGMIDVLVIGNFVARRASE